MTRGSTLAFTSAALAVALIGSAGSVYLSVGMGLNACPLCFYERTFVFGVLAVLIMSQLAGSRIAAGVPCLLVAPLAAAGLGVAAFHVWLEVKGTLECPDGVLGLGTAPQQSLAMFVLLTAVVIAGGLAAEGAATSLKVLAALVLGGALAYASIASAPPLPPAKVRPTKAEGHVLKGCEPAPLPAASQPAGAAPEPPAAEADRLAAELRDPLLGEIKALLARGEKITAIKRYREATGVGLALAKDVVERVAAASGR
jgi:disulfide bond formation protein DsbB